MIITRPMKAETVLTVDVDGKKGLENVVWPMWASPKLDGWRLLIHPTLGPVTQSFKQIPNCHVHEELTTVLTGSHLDGEINCTNEDGNALPYNKTQSQLASYDGQPTWKFTVFDWFDLPGMDFSCRARVAGDIVKKINHPCVEFLPHVLISSLEEFNEYADWCMDNGYEGVVLRHAAGPYKSGRSTFLQAWMLKWKPWEDAEGIIVGFEEMMHNENEQTTSALGLSKRSSHKEGMRGSGMLGNFIVDTVEFGLISCGGGKGFTHKDRKLIWENYLQSIEDKVSPPFFGRKVTYRFQRYGMKDKPRFPNLKGWSTV